MYLVKEHTAQILSNAQTSKESCRGIIKLPLLRYEAIADFYLCQPAQIRVKLNESEELDIFEQIFRIRTWLKNRYMASWSIFSNTRDLQDEDNMGLVLRNCIWDRSSDMNKVRNTDNKETLLHSWPNIICVSNYIPFESSTKFGLQMKKMDNAISEGIKVVPRKNELNKEWNQIEVYRQFNWGGSHSIWDITMEDFKIEKEIEDLILQFKETMKVNKVQVYQMEFDYLFPPDIFKDLVCGDFRE